MNTTNDFQLYNVHIHKHIRIPMPDGVELDAHLFMPDASGPFPAVFDYYPYRKDDLSAGNLRIQYYLAQRGFVGVRIDVRGTGSSGGTAVDEYSLQEHLDAVEAIAWMAEQPWCNGNVGMFGSSYGGFNSLQVAMHRPPALKAICPMYFTDNRYTDDCHYKGGAMQMLYDMATYGLGMVVQNALPPYPDATDERWAETWEEHLQSEPWLLTWLSNHVYNDYWKHGSLCEDYAAIECAVYLFGGWRDGYTNCNLRTFDQLRCPKKVIVGPWLHVAPDQGIPGPRINHLHEMVRFYEYWLKGVDNGIMDEPPVTLYVQQYDPPRADRALTSGFWQHEAEWPPARAEEHLLYLTDNDNLQTQQTTTTGGATYTYNPTVGTTFGMFSAAAPHILPMDQQLEDAYSLNWTSEPLTDSIEMLGYGRVVLYVTTTTDIATVVVRLIDVAPDGTAALVTKGLLNLTHRDSHEQPSPLEPDQVYEVTVPLDATSWLFESGHQIRIGIAGADFPNSWPSPKPYVGTIHFGGNCPARLLLPTVGSQNPALPAPKLEPPAQTKSLVDSESDQPVWRVTRDHMAGTAEVFVRTSGRTRIDDRFEFVRTGEATTRVAEEDPAHATIRGLSQVILHWPERTIHTRARGQVESTETTLNVTIQLDITMDDVPYLNKRWVRSIPRNLL
ncbi:CocE/NonD family hydrolase [Chloroflexi bacterium TSY]|nr:CocE/NonD family hydrolase [Chloroflexi bacterium TSY]